MLRPTREKLPLDLPLTVSLLAALLGLCGCPRMIRLEENIERYKRLTRITGVVTSEARTRKPIVVVAVRTGAGDPLVLGYRRLSAPGPFRLVVPTADIMVVAFEDLNENLKYQAGEPSGGYLGYRSFRVPAPPKGKQRQMDGITIHLRANDEPPPEIAAVKAPIQEQRDFHAGTVSRLDRARFGKKAGEFGVWEPIDFVFEYGAGIFFMGEYDPEQVPVLFVHGLGGYGQEFETMIQKLPPGFQPWIAAYPSGWNLEEVAEYLMYLLDEARFRTGAQKLCIVAHSMGGVLIRHMLGQMSKNDIDGSWIRSFITLASPLHGHPATESGVRFSPVVVPAWRSLLPNGETIRQLYAHPLPGKMAYTLVFSIKDKSVPLESQLRDEAQEEALRTHGIHAGHAGVLEHSRTLEIVYAEIAGVQALQP